MSKSSSKIKLIFEWKFGESDIPIDEKFLMECFNQSDLFHEDFKLIDVICEEI